MRSPLLSLKCAYKFSQELSGLFNEGIYLSSVDFYNELEKMEGVSKGEKEKLQLSYSKYYLRSCTRCTPFGTFAGSMLVNVSAAETRIILEDPNQHVRRIRIDANYINEIINALLRSPVIRTQIMVFPNNSIYELSNSFRYVEYFIKNNVRSYRLTSVKKTKYLAAVLKSAKNGALLQSLVDLLVKSENVENSEAEEFIAEMYRSQLLIADLEPCITGIEPLDKLISQLGSFTGIDELLNKFKKIQTLIKCPKTGVDCYKEIEQELKQIGIPTEIPQNTLQTDLFLATSQKNISKDIIEAISLQIEELLSFSRLISNSALEIFKNKFNEKYDQEEIELSIVLDAELGIGYAESNQSASGAGKLIDDLKTDPQQHQQKNQFEPIEQFTLLKYKDYLENRKDTINLTEDELLKFKEPSISNRFSNSFYLLGSFMKKLEKFDSENFIFDVSGIVGQSAGKLLARFAHGDEDFFSFTKQILKEEEEECPDAIYAEFAHLPQARIGNIMHRPVLGSYEVPYVGRSGIDAKYQIQVSDIMVSVRNNEVVLRSKKHNKRIIPRLTTAHVFSSQGLPIYKFLGDLQFQGKARVNVWDWGVLSSFSYLPRVTYKNLILKKARWTID